MIHVTLPKNHPYWSAGDFSCLVMEKIILFYNKRDGRAAFYIGKDGSLFNTGRKTVK